MGSVSASLAGLLLVLSAAARAEAPPAKDYFRPLLADPEELHYDVRYTARQDLRHVGEMGMGDYFGVWRGHPGPVDVQLSLGGGVIGRFDIAHVTNDFLVGDFTFAAPVDVHRGAHDLRLAYWHVSSHLGDDFVRLNAPVLQKATTDELRSLYSFETGRYRFYGGYGWAFHALPAGRGTSRFQAGAEWYGAPLKGWSAQPVAAAHAESLEWTGWSPDLTLRVGLRAVPAGGSGGATYFVEFFNGHLPYQQFGTRSEEHWALGVRFEMGSPVRAPS